MTKHALSNLIAYGRNMDGTMDYSGVAYETARIDREVTKIFSEAMVGYSGATDVLLLASLLRHRFW